MLIRSICVIVTGLVLMFSGTATGVSFLDGNFAEATGVCQVGVVGCGFGEGDANGHKSGPGDQPGHCSGTSNLSPDEVISLLFMREEEKLARDSYLELGELWGLAIFDNIFASEQKHMDAMKRLLDCYKLTDPVLEEIGEFYDPWLQQLFDDLMFEGQKSMMNGLFVGALIEETDMRDIQVAIEVTVHPDIVSTYESLLCGSRNHLRAFIRQVEINGGAYTPTVLDPDEFWLIAYSDMEQGCWSH